MAGRYASEMAERGVVALAFDFRTWGQSEGATRSLEDPVMKISDIHADADFMTTRTEVASIHGLGICACAGYMATAATGGTPLQSVSLVAPWLHDRDLVLSVYGGEAGVAALVETGRAAAAQEQASGKPQLIPAAGPPGSDALMSIGGYYIDSKRGLVKEWENTFNLASWEKWLTFNGIAPGKGITMSTTIVHSDAAAIPEGAKKFFATVPGQKNSIGWTMSVSLIFMITIHRSTSLQISWHNILPRLLLKKNRSSYRRSSPTRLLKRLL